MRFVNIDHLLIHVDDGDYRGTDCDNAICQHRIKIMFVTSTCYQHCVSEQVKY